MEKDIQEIKITMARMEITQEYIKKNLANLPIPVCEKMEIKTKVAFQGKLIWFTFALILGGVGSMFVKTALAFMNN